MSAQPHPTATVVSVEEYLAREVAAEFRSEFIAGHVFAMAGASRNHNQLVSNVTAALVRILRDRACSNYAYDMRVGVQGGAAYLYPDIVVTCGAEDFSPTVPPTLLNPLVIAEVLSPTTEARDRGDKFLQYQTILSLKEYILITQWPRRFESFVKQASGVWVYRSHPENPTALEVASLACTISFEDVYNKVGAESAS